MKKLVRISSTAVILVALLSACSAPAVPVAVEPTDVPVAVEPTTLPVAVEPTVAPAVPLATEVTKNGGTLSLTIRLKDFDTLDPHTTNLTQAAWIFKNIYDKLVYKEGDKIYPGLALSWMPNEDYTAWTLTLRKGVTFHDGSPFNAEVVAFNFDRMVDPATKSKSARSEMGPYDRTEIVDDYTVVVHFKSPRAVFDLNLASDYVSMISMKQVLAVGSDKFRENPVGTGPFKYVSQISSAEVILEKNPDYNWAPEFMQHQGAPYLDKVIFHFALEDETRMSALETGAAQIIDNIPPARNQGLRDAGFQVIGLPRLGLPRMANLNTKAWPTDDILVRKALNFAKNPLLIEKTVTRGLYPDAKNVIAPGTPFYDDAAELYSYDPAKARSLLEEAGYKDMNADGYRVKGGRVLEMLYYTFADSQAELTAEAFQAMMKEVGIKVNVEVVPSAQLYSIAEAGSKVNASFIGTGSPDPGPPLIAFFHTEGKGSTQYSQFINAELDALMYAGMETSDSAKRQEIYSKIQMTIMENALVVPLTATVMWWASTPEVKGFHADPYPHPYLYDVYFEK